MGYKQVIIIRQDLKLPKGKMATQAAHASVDAVMKTSRDIVNDWKREGMKKVVVKAKDLSELVEYENIARESELKFSVITDAGKTTVEPGTITCMAIGPDEEEKIDKITVKLPLM